MLRAARVLERARQSVAWGWLARVAEYLTIAQQRQGLAALQLVLLFLEEEMLVAVEVVAG